MLTLDRMTLFFFSLSDSYRQADSEEEQSALINDWSSRVVGQPNRKRAGGASKASTPTLTSGTSKPSRASKASSSSRTALNNKVKIRNSDKYDNVVDDNGGFVSEDERYSGERVLAANSPLKGKGNRVTSSVSAYYLLALNLLIY